MAIVHHGSTGIMFAPLLLIFVGDVLLWILGRTAYCRFDRVVAYSLAVLAIVLGILYALAVYA